MTASGAASTASPGLSGNYTLPGNKTVDSYGVVIVPCLTALPPTPAADPDHERGITSYRGLLFGETMSPLTQVKMAVLHAGTPSVQGWFCLHNHPEPAPMEEVFIVTSGKVMFRLVLPDGTEQIVPIGQNGMIAIPPSVKHEGWNEDDEPAVMFVIGCRTGIVHPCDAGKKGVAIPAAA